MANVEKITKKIRKEVADGRLVVSVVVPKPYLALVGTDVIMSNVEAQFDSKVISATEPHESTTILNLNNFPLHKEGLVVIISTGKSIGNVQENIDNFKLEVDPIPSAKSPETVLIPRTQEKLVAAGVCIDGSTIDKMVKMHVNYRVPLKYLAAFVDHEEGGRFGHVHIPAPPRAE